MCAPDAPEAAARGHVYAAHVGALHDAVVTSAADARVAKHAVAAQKATVGSTLRAVSGALDARRAQMHADKEAHARHARDAVRAAARVAVPQHVAAAITRSSRGGLALCA